MRWPHRQNVVLGLYTALLDLAHCRQQLLGILRVPTASSGHFWAWLLLPQPAGGWVASGLAARLRIMQVECIIRTL